jgi:RNA polymerase subunit RPABC4/transcription elongation factor Spt4
MKRCQRCRQPIQRRATVCPWCQSEQKSLIRDGLNVIALIIFVIIAAAFAAHVQK